MNTSSFIFNNSNNQESLNFIQDWTPSDLGTSDSLNSEYLNAKESFDFGS